MIFIYWLILGGLVGAVIGQYKDRPVSGFWLGAFLGPIGWCITALSRSEMGELRAYEDHLADIRLREEQMHAAEAPKPVRKLTSIQTWRISRNGEDLGALDLPAIKLRLKTGKLSPDDLVFNEKKGDWIPISEDPMIYEKGRTSR